MNNCNYIFFLFSVNTANSWCYFICTRYTNIQYLWWWYGKAHSLPPHKRPKKKFKTDKKPRRNAFSTQNDETETNQFKFWAMIDAMLSLFYSSCWKLREVFDIQFTFGAINIGYWPEMALKSILYSFTRFSTYILVSLCPIWIKWYGLFLYGQVSAHFRFISFFSFFASCVDLIWNWLSFFS